MKITVIGGSSGTGALLGDLAQRSGHEVTALSRRGTLSRHDLEALLLEVLEGEATIGRKLGVSSR